jgi:hypothetical protein
MMRHFVSAACGLWIGLSGMASAQTQPVLVELYTSQGCSACPPADDFMALLAADPDVIALSLHVDYWDYIGWKDTFASPVFTDRQKAYAQAIGSRTIYTPQMIVAGDERVEGNNPVKVADTLRRHAGAKSPVTLRIARSGGKIVIHAESDPPLSAGARVQLVRYIAEETVTIGRGENAGREVTYFNVVTDWADLGGWSGLEPLDIVADAAGAAPVVVIVQYEGPGAVLAAARLR